MLIPTEARATMGVYREGRTLEQFLDDMWKRRAVEHPVVRRKPRGKWPFVRVEDLTNVTSIKGRKRA